MERSRYANSEQPIDEAALNRMLEAEPQSVSGLVGMGNLKALAGDDSLACYYYRKALRSAEGRALSEGDGVKLGSARQALAALESRVHAKREQRLRERGLPPDEWSSRFRQSLEVAAGHKKIFQEEPTAYHYPGLPAVQFYDTSEFTWVPAVEAASAAIRDELRGLLAGGDEEFRAYVQHSTVATEANRALLGSKDWSILGLCENGWLAPQVVKRCPRTWETVLETPLPRIPGWGPTAVFSMLKAGARIAPHTGMSNIRLICHLPLIVPSGCAFRVGNEVREWEEGKLMIFNDTIEHEAWNDSGEDRVVLIFDIWRPELTEREKHELMALFSD